MTFTGMFNRFFKSRVTEQKMEKKSGQFYLVHADDGQGKRIGWIPVQVPWSTNPVHMDSNLADAVRRLLREGHVSEAQTLVGWFEENPHGA